MPQHLKELNYRPMTMVNKGLFLFANPQDTGSFSTVKTNTYVLVSPPLYSLWYHHIYLLSDPALWLTLGE
jgi:hypothetical protein